MASLKNYLVQYFNLAEDLVPQADAEAAIREGVSFKGTNMLILILAIFIASLGLNTNSTAVIIGAMLISPLMGPSSVSDSEWECRISNCSTARCATS